MKHQNLLLLSLVLTFFPPICAGKTGGQRYKEKRHRTGFELASQDLSVANQALDKTKALPTIITSIQPAVQAPSSSILALPPSPKQEEDSQKTTDFSKTFETIPSSNQDARTPQVALGSLDRELNKSWFIRLVSSRDVRGSAERIIKNFDPQQNLFGSGDPEENKRLFEATVDSYIYHNEPIKLATLIAFLTASEFATRNDVPKMSEKLSSEQVQSCLKAQQAYLEGQRKTLEPHVEMAKELQEKEQKIASVLAILQSK